MSQSLQKTEHSRSSSHQSSLVDIRMTFQDRIRESSLKSSVRSTAHLRNRTTFSTRKVRPQEVTQLFQSVFDRIQQHQALPSKRSKSKWEEKRSRGSGKEGRGREGQEEVPARIVNSLYRQNIKNYNAFTATLQTLEEEELGAG
jgi:hypothetical protein